MGSSEELENSEESTEHRGPNPGKGRRVDAEKICSDLNSILSHFSDPNSPTMVSVPAISHEVQPTETSRRRQPRTPKSKESNKSRCLKERKRRTTLRKGIEKLRKILEETGVDVDGMSQSRILNGVHQHLLEARQKLDKSKSAVISLHARRSQLIDEYFKMLLPQQKSDTEESDQHAQ